MARGGMRAPNQKWRRVKGPRMWHPKPGENLHGRYGGRTLKNGAYGQYDVIIVHPMKGGDTYMVSGTVLIQAVDVAQLTIGEEIVVRFVEWRETTGDRCCKIYELYVREDRHGKEG